MFCVLPNTLARWLYFTDSNPPPYQFTLFASTIYGLSGVFDLVLLILTRPKMVVGDPLLTDVTHRRHKLARNSLRMEKVLSGYDYGILSIDIENTGRGARWSDSSFELQSPSRTKNRERSFDLQGVNSLPFSPTSDYSDA